MMMNARSHSLVVRKDAATTELYLVAMFYGHVGTRDTYYQSVRLSASTYCVPIQTSMIKLWCNYVFI